eukprot:7455993-Alexandrium_andersonii.AAC.1
MVMELARRMRGWTKAQETASVQKADAATTGVGTGAGLDREHTMALRNIPSSSTRTCAPRTRSGGPH